MALEQAGVELIAKNFSKYIGQLEQIDKTQRKVFNVSSRRIDKTFSGATKSARRYDKELKKVEKDTRKVQSSTFDFATAIKGLALGMAAREVFEFGQESVNLARIQASAEAQLASAIKSTGGAAGLTAGELKNMASALQQTTNFGDEATIQAEALLLTFTKIGRETFPDALTAVLDVSTAMGTDLRSASIQVGKALNDPVRGLDALSRSGIQFSQAQRDLIKNFAETGRIADAQAIILQELNRQFSGSAEAARQADGGVIALQNAFGDLKEEVGFIILNMNEATGSTESLTGVVEDLTGQISDFGDQIEPALQGLAKFAQTNKDLIAFLAPSALALAETTANMIPFGDVALGVAKSLGENLAKSAEKGIKGIEELGTAQQETNQDLETTTDIVEENTEAVDKFGQAIKRAEDLQLSFARAQEDAARQANRQLSRLNEQQAKDREKLLKDQAKQFDEFEKDRQKQIAKAEADIVRERKRAAEQRLRDQQRLQRQLRQAQERFSLDQLQSERRFQLSDKRLRAEGDILALQQLREDQALARQEEAENFNLSQRQTKESAEAQQRQQSDDLNQRLEELKANLEDQRAELLAGFDEQLAEQQVSQQEQRQDLLKGLAEQEEDRRISQQRQLEDLGRSLAGQKDITQEGVAAIAGEFETIFGKEGVADTIMTGFSDRTESEFAQLFDELESIVGDANLPLSLSPKTAPGRLGGLSEFQEGGVVPGPVGSPQLAMVHGGETVLPTHKQSFTMAAPIIPSQNVNVEMSGGFDIRGAEQAGEATVRAAVEEVVNSMEIAIKRMARRTNG